MSRPWLVLVSAGLSLSACSGSDGGDPTNDVALDTGAAIPDVCRLVGTALRCPLGTHVQPRTSIAQQECKDGIAERRCGYVRFLLEKCLDDVPVCYDPSGNPTSDSCQRERARFVACKADDGR